MLRRPGRCGGVLWSPRSLGVQAVGRGPAEGGGWRVSWGSLGGVPCAALHPALRSPVLNSGEVVRLRAPSPTRTWAGGAPEGRGGRLMPQGKLERSSFGPWGTRLADGMEPGRLYNLEGMRGWGDVWFWGSSRKFWVPDGSQGFTTDGGGRGWASPTPGGAFEGPGVQGSRPSSFLAWELWLQLNSTPALTGPRPSPPPTQPDPCWPLKTQMGFL